MSYDFLPFFSSKSRFSPWKSVENLDFRGLVLGNGGSQDAGGVVDTHEGLAAISAPRFRHRFGLKASQKHEKSIEKWRKMAKNGSKRRLAHHVELRTEQTGAAQRGDRAGAREEARKGVARDR